MPWQEHGRSGVPLFCLLRYVVARFFPLSRFALVSVLWWCRFRCVPFPTLPFSLHVVTNFGSCLGFFDQ